MAQMISLSNCNAEIVTLYRCYRSWNWPLSSKEAVFLTILVFKGFQASSNLRNKYYLLFDFASRWFFNRREIVFCLLKFNGISSHLHFYFRWCDKMLLINCVGEFVSSSSYTQETLKSVFWISWNNRFLIYLKVYNCK